MLDQGLDFAAIWADIVKRPYITIGMAAFLVLLPLAVTSNNAMVRRLGGPAWQRLHRWVYLAAAAAAVHFVMVVKAWPPEPLVYAGIVACCWPTGSCFACSVRPRRTAFAPPTVGAGRKARPPDVRPPIFADRIRRVPAAWRIRCEASVAEPLAAVGHWPRWQRTWCPLSGRTAASGMVVRQAATSSGRERRSRRRREGSKVPARQPRRKRLWLA